MRCRSYRKFGQALARSLPFLAFGDNHDPEIHGHGSIDEALRILKVDKITETINKAIFKHIDDPNIACKVQDILVKELRLTELIKAASEASLHPDEHKAGPYCESVANTARTRLSILLKELGYL